MQNFRKFLEDNKIAFEDERFGECYFRGVDPIRYRGVRITFDIMSAEDARKRRRIEQFVKRSGKYEIFGAAGYPGYQWFCVARKDDRDAARLYRSFSSPAVASCEKEIHIRREMGLKDYAAEEQICRGIMEFWQEEYKKALASA